MDKRYIEVRNRMLLVFFSMLMTFSLCLEYYGVYHSDRFTIFNGCILSLTNMGIVLHYIFK